MPDYLEDDANPRALKGVDNSTFSLVLHYPDCPEISRADEDIKERLRVVAVSRAIADGDGL